ncbi:PRC-barrel domain-containing protein [Candidatus Nitrospira bockiana]
MTPRAIISLTVGALLLAGLQPAWADRDDRAGSAVYRASNLIGKDVKNAQGEDLGEIKDIVLDPYYGKVAYAVLSFGGFLGLGDKYFAIPWRALEPAKDGDHLLLNVDKARLKTAPGFDKDQWPDMANREWARQVHQFYDQPPYWEGRPARGIAVKGQQATIQGEVLNIKDELYVIKDASGREVRMHVDQDTKIEGQIKPGDKIQAEITQASHAQSIKKAQ